MPSSMLKKGQIIAHFGQTALILNEDQEQLSIKLRPKLGTVVVGDWIEYQKLQHDYVACNLLERFSCLKRGAKLVAANLTQMIIMIAPKPYPQFELIDSYLIAAQIAGVKPLLILNKIDLVDDINHAQLMELMSIYQNLAINTLQISSLNKHNFADLQLRLQHQTSVIVGQSGVGKTSVINALLPEQQGKVQELSSITQGKHTTCVSQLFCLPNGGKLIDSPGVRSFALQNLSFAQLNACFTEVSSQINKCKFRNCRHQNEVNCAVQKALKCGLIHPQRWQSYQRISQTI